LKAARNWAASKPINVRDLNDEAGSNADMRCTNLRAGATGIKTYSIVSPHLAKPSSSATVWGDEMEADKG
jgi:hypothetical protein